jgi:hypothetical protein
MAPSVCCEKISGTDGARPHIAVTVDGLDSTLANLAEQGIEPERPPYSVREGGSRLCFVRNPDSSSPPLNPTRIFISSRRMPRGRAIEAASAGGLAVNAPTPAREALGNFVHKALR